jgi:hypothetical protein
MRIRLALALSALVAVDALAVAPQFWRVRSADDFLAGDIEGFAVTSRGELKAGPSLKKVATFTDPFVLSQASGANGDHYFGTGNDGKVYRLRGTELKLVFTSPEPEVYALAFRDGALFVGSSPNGKIYRVNPTDGSSTTLFDPKQAYVWAIAPIADGALAVATGVEGKLFRVAANGEGKLWFDAPETHLRSLAVKTDGRILAGGSGQGRIYEVRGEGSAHALYDSSLSEISAIYVDSAGVGWAAGASSVLPSSAPAAKPAQTKPATQSGSASTSASGSTEAKKDEATGSVDVSFTFDDQSAANAQAGSGELYRINTDGFVEVIRKFDREMIYAISAGREPGSILLSTGPQGRLYELRTGEVSLLATVPEKQIVSIAANGGGSTLITTTNSGAVYQMQNGAPTKAEFRSAAKDVDRFSRFGHYRIEGQELGGGNLAIATWSQWSAASTTAEGAVDVPAGRYVQWRLTMPKPSNGVSVDTVTVSYMNRNMPPVIDGLAVQEPAVVFITGSYPPSPQVVEATNPDEYGIFTSLDSPRDKNDPGKKVFRKGFRTVTWRAHDDNGDAIRYSLSFRRKGSDRWLRLRENVDETSMNFDTSQMPDGTYELRLLATDATDNPDAPQTDAKEGVEFLIDNTPPAVTARRDGSDVVIQIADKASPVGKVEYSADAQKWIRITPVDGIADSAAETYRLKRAETDGKFVIVRAVDAFFNVATESITLP